MTSRGLVLAASVALGGCHMHADTHIVAPDANVPVSLSETVRDEDGDIVAPERQQLIGNYDLQFTTYSWLWNTVGVNEKTDVSQSINAAVARVKGDAITEMSVAVDACWSASFLLYAWLLPFIPACANYHLRGHIVTVLPKPPPPPPPPPTTPPSPKRPPKKGAAK